MLPQPKLPLLLLLFALFATGCSVSPTVAAITSSDGVQMVRPQHILAVWPGEGQSASRAEIDAQRAWPGSLCIEVDARPIVRSGERLYLSEMVERITLAVDGTAVPLALAQEVSTLNKVTIAGQESAYSGPFTFCWDAHLTPGPHQARFQYAPPTGPPLQYAWSFTVLR